LGPPKKVKSCFSFFVFFFNVFPHIGNPSQKKFGGLGQKEAKKKINLFFRPSFPKKKNEIIFF